jgi:hypothetical protein
MEGVAQLTTGRGIRQIDYCRLDSGGKNYWAPHSCQHSARSLWETFGELFAQVLPMVVKG